MAAPSKKSYHGSVGSSSGDLISVVYNFFKKVSMVGAVYLIGYMQWSVAWLLCPIIFSVIRDQWRRESELRRSIAKATATTSEKDVVLARIDDLPAWVFFPDMERAEWFNRILQQVWPRVNHYARNLLKDVIEPNIATSLAAYKLQGFKFERMILGTIAPRVGGVKVYDKNVCRNEIIMDVDLFYAGDCDISFSLKGLKGGIKDLQIHGMTRVVMKPLISSIPFVGGLQVFFLNNPAIDFNLVGAADVLDMPGFSDILRRCIVEQVANMMVLPNKLPIKLSDEVPSYDLRMPEPEGVVRIHVVEAKNLMKKDIGMLGKGKSDPYAVINVGAQEFRTKTIDNNVNPRWDFWCEAAVMQTHGQTLELSLFDYDDSSKDEKLGRCSLDINSIYKKGRMDTWLTLQEAKHGMVHLRLTWLHLSSDGADLKEAYADQQILRNSSISTAVLCVYIDSLKNLPNARPQSKPDVYLVVSAGKKTENSAVQMRVSDPVYEIGYSFLIANPENDSLTIKVMDQKTGNQIGQFVYILATLLNKPKLSVDTQPFILQKAGPESKIIMSMCLKVLKFEEEDSSAKDDSDTQSETQSTAGEQAPGDEKPQEGSEGGVSRESSVRGSLPGRESGNTSTPVTPSPIKKMVPPPLPEQDSIDSNFVQDESAKETLIPEQNASPPSSPTIVHRTMSITSSAGEAGLGRIQLTLRYSGQRQRLIVVVHKIAHIPLKDPSNIPDPYVKLYLLPSRSKESKRKTIVMKDNCNPVYDEHFEYVLTPSELTGQQLEVTVATQKGFLSGGSPVIGQVIVNLAEYDLSQAQTFWFDLLPESTRD